MTSPEVAIVGAGIIGIQAAHALADEGRRVVIYDREGPAAGASRGNAGWIAHADVLPLASPKILARVPRFLMDPLGPLAIRPAYLATLLPWLVRFVAASRPKAHARSLEALLALHALVRPAWEARLAALGLGHLVRETGGLYLHDDAATIAAMRPVHRRLSDELGLVLREIAPADIPAIEPAVIGRFAGGVLVGNTAHVTDPREVTETLFAQAQARGIGFERAEVRAVEADPSPALHLADGRRITADIVVVAAGAWSKPLAAGLGDDIPLDTERGYNVSFPTVTGLLSRPVAFESHGFVATPLASGLRIGGAVEFAGLDAPPNHDRTRALHAKARRFLADVPPFETGSVWMGFRPSIPDSLPVIGPSGRSDRVVHAFGHGHLGLTQSAATARLVADIAARRPAAIDLTPFSARRFR